MMRKKIGETVYIVSNGVLVMSGIIRGISKEFCILVLEDGSSTRLKNSRIFESKEEAELSLLKHKSMLNKDFFNDTESIKKRVTPYDYMD